MKYLILIAAAFVIANCGTEVNYATPIPPEPDLPTNNDSIEIEQLGVWEKIPMDFPQEDFVAVESFDTASFIVVSKSGLYKTNDGGANWKSFPEITNASCVQRWYSPHSSLSRDVAGQAASVT